MKKLIILILFLFILVGCEPEEETVIETVVPNGLEPLVAVEDCENPTLEGGWTCIWADEFDGDVVDETKWNFEDGGYGGGNQELQYYTRNNTEIVDGKLVITAKKESYMGKEYTSSRLNTKYKGNFKYVRIKVGAKMPAGRGMWGAIWMMPLMNAYGGWPNSGEIDINEYVGYDENRIYTTIHTEKFNHNLGNQIGFSRVIQNAETEFHDYEMIWTPGSIKVYVDDYKFGDFNYVPVFNSEVPYQEAFPFDQQFFLILNLAVGGTWGGSQGVDNTAFPSTLEVDYVRVYQQDFATLDKERPDQPVGLTIGTLKNSIYWTKATDDYGVEEYAIFLDGVFHKYVRMNQVILTGLTAGNTYAVQVQAVDFVGRISDKSQTLSFSYTA